MIIPRIGVSHEPVAVPAAVPTAEPISCSMPMYNDLVKARLEQPEGVICGFCGGVNEYADDCGFFYVTDPKDGVYKSTCSGPKCPQPQTAER